jgi:hypothetical protein
MGSIVGNARKVFGEFVRCFEEKHGDHSWKLNFDDGDLARLGLSRKEVDGALDVLETKGLVEGSTGGGHYALTDEGVDVCLEPSSIDGYLPRPAP